MTNNQRIGAIGSGVGALAIIIAAVFTGEGGYNNDPKDPGGATNHGITERVARQHDYKGDMKDLPKEKAEEIYKQDYVSEPRFDAVIALSPALGHKLVDAGVNVGPARATKWFQEALNSVSRGCKDYPCVTVDGAVGGATLRAYQGLQRVRGPVVACQTMLKLIDAQQASHYMSLKQMVTFTPGWVINRVGNVPLQKCELTAENYK